MKKRVCLSILFLIILILVFNSITAQDAEEKSVEDMTEQEIIDYVQEIADIETTKTLTSEHSEKIKEIIEKEPQKFMQAFEKLTPEQQTRLFYDKTDTGELFLPDEEKNIIWNYLNQDEKQILLKEITNKFLKQTYKKLGDSSAYPELKGQVPKIENININDPGNTLKWQGNKLLNQQGGYINLATGHDQIDPRTSSINYNGESFELGFLKDTKFFTYEQGTFAYNTEYPQGCVIGPDGKIIGGDKKLTFLYGRSSEQDPAKISVEYLPQEKGKGEGKETKYIAEFSVSGDLEKSSLRTVDKYGNSVHLRQQGSSKKGKFITKKVITGYGGLFGRRPIYGYKKTWVPDKTPVKQTSQQPAIIRVDENNMISVKGSQINTAGRGVFTSSEDNFQILAGNFFNEPEKGLRDLEAEITEFAKDLFIDEVVQEYKSKLQELDENSAEYEKEIDKLSRYLIKNKANDLVTALKLREAISEKAEEVTRATTGIASAIIERGNNQFRNLFGLATTPTTTTEEQTPEEKTLSRKARSAVFIALTKAIGNPIAEKVGRVLSLREPISATISTLQEMDIDPSQIEQRAIQKFAEKSLNPSYKEFEKQNQDYIYVNDNKNEITGGVFSEIRIGAQNPITVDVTEFHGTLDRFFVNDYAQDENKVNLINGGFSMTFDNDNTYYQRGSTPYSRTEIKQIKNTNSERTWVLDKSHYRSFRLYDPAKLRSYTHSQSGFGIFGMLRNRVAEVNVEGAPTGDSYTSYTDTKVEIKLLQSGIFVNLGLVPQSTVTGQLAQKISQGTYNQLLQRIQSAGGQDAFLEQLEQAKRLTTNNDLKTIATQRGWYDSGIEDQIYLTQNLNQLDAVTHTIGNLHNQYNLQRSTLELGNDGIYLNGQQITITDSSGKTITVDPAVYRQIKHGIATEVGSPQVYGLIQAFSMRNQPAPSPHNLDQEFNFLSTTSGRGTSTTTSTTSTTTSTTTPPTPPETQTTSTTSTIPKQGESWDDENVETHLKTIPKKTQTTTPTTSSKDIQTKGFTSELLTWKNNLITDKTNPDLSLNLDKIPQEVKEIQYIKATDSEPSKLIYEFENGQQIILEQGSLDENMQLTGIPELKDKDISFEFGKENPEGQRITIKKDHTIEYNGDVKIQIGDRSFKLTNPEKPGFIKIIESSYFQVKNTMINTPKINIYTPSKDNIETHVIFKSGDYSEQKQYVQISEEEIKVKGSYTDMILKQ